MRFVRGGHLQTLGGYLRRRLLTWTRPSEDRVVDAGEGMKLLVRATWQPGPRKERPAVVLVHGLSGDDRSTHVVATAAYAWSRGWHVLRMNMRGAGDGALVCPRLYNAGLDTDLVAVLQDAAKEVASVAVAGFSLGANLALLAAGRRAAQFPPNLLGVAAVSPPVDLEACVTALGRRSNRIYERHMLGELCRAYHRIQAAAPDCYPAGREVGLKSVRAYDEAITAPHAGYSDAAAYYSASSAGPHLIHVHHPTLMVAAADDPMIPIMSIERWPRSRDVQLEVTPTGGHVGFAGRAKCPGRFWAGLRVMEFFEGLAAPAR